MCEDMNKEHECCGGNDEDCCSGHDHDHDCCGGNDDDCGCGHDHDHGHPDVITLTMENDEEVECAVLGIFDVEDQEYIALVPEEGDNAFIYIYNETEDGQVSLENIESQEDFDKVSAVFLEIIENDNEAADEDDE